MFGMDSVLQNLAILNPKENPYNKPTTNYMLNPNINTFLKQFRTLTDFCDYKCGSLFNFPCFVLFNCSIQIRNFVSLLLLPFIILSLAALCCSRGIWTFGCWFKYIFLFTGIKLIIWGINKCANGGSLGDRTSSESELEKKRKNKD
jgi:hypothetical protein